LEAILVTFQLDWRRLTSVTTWAAVALILTLSACTQPKSDTLPQADSTPAAEQSAEPVAEEATAHPAVQQEASPPAATKEAADEPVTEEPDPFAVPDGSPEELLEYVEGLMDVRPKSNDMAGFAEYRKNIGQAMVTAADGILAKTPTDEQAKKAVFLMLNGLTTLESTGDAAAAERLQGLPAELEKAGLSKFVRMAKSFPLQGRLKRARRMQPDEIKQLIGEVEAFLGDGPMQAEDVNMAMRAGMMAEDVGDNEWAGEVCKRLGMMISENEDKSIASMGAKLIGVGRRMNLVGNEMPLEGVTLEGEPLDWSKYEGKVVLVDFWTTWCGPCIQEIPNIRQNYDAYHNRGFDVIGISVDRDREALVSFMNEHEEPWVVLCDRDLAESPTGEMMADRYGIFSIPTMALIGTDGKVVTMNPRGPKLGRELEKLLGPAEEKKEEQATGEEKDGEAEKKQ
jgi:thiol-disulfide isomerase/thioredoxin